MTVTAFDPGYVAEPFLALVADAPGAEVYPAQDFRVEWGPIFHRGRLDGTARLLVIGQDPAQHETVARRILIGEAGRRTQGLLARLGLDRDYVLINAFLYSVFGQQGGEAHRDDPAIIAYRNRWLDAIVATSPIAGVLALGGLARSAYEAWPGGSAVPHAFAIHPTFPDSSSASVPAGPQREAAFAGAMKQLCTSWNKALGVLGPVLGVPAPKRYGTMIKAADKAEIPVGDLPAGMPAWMAHEDDWAARTGRSAELRRATITVTVPEAARPWH